MPECIRITDLSSPCLAPYTALTEKQLLRADFVIAEGTKVISAALDTGAICRSFLMEEKHAAGKAAPLIARTDAPIYVADEATLNRLTGYPLTRGVLACFERPSARSCAEVLHGARRVTVLDGLNDAENVGALFRSAAALGLDGILLTETCRDPLTRRSLRVSMGTILRLPWARIPALESGGAEELHACGFRCIALALHNNSLPIDAPSLSREKKLALVLGAEGDGLSDHAIAACDGCAVIPMAPGVDSLNVAAAGAIAMWQTRYQI